MDVDVDTCLNFQAVRINILRKAHFFIKNFVDQADFVSNASIEIFIPLRFYVLPHR